MSEARSLLHQLDRGTASHVRGLLEETFGGFYDGFEEYLTSELPWHEWRYELIKRVNHRLGELT